MTKSKLKGSDIPAWGEIKSKFDLDKVAETVRTNEVGTEETRLNTHDFEDAANIIWHAAETWMGRDLLEFQIDTVEQPHYFKDKRGFLDVTGRVNGLIKPYDEFTGMNFVLDWKTRDGFLSTDWKNKLMASHQWELYAAMTDARLFIYRGLSRQGDHREINIRIPDNNTQRVVQHIDAVNATATALLPFSIWPQTRPDSCSIGTDYECSFFGDCDAGTIPERLIEKLPSSYTGMKNFMRCNEFYRRSTFAPQGFDDSIHSIFGGATHRGLAELWRQSKEVKL